MSGKVGPLSVSAEASRLSYAEMAEEYDRMARGYGALKGRVAELEAEHAVMVEVFADLQQCVFPLGTDADVVRRLNKATASFSKRAKMFLAVIDAAKEQRTLHEAYGGLSGPELGHAVCAYERACRRTEALLRAMDADAKDGSE